MVRCVLTLALAAPAAADAFKTAKCSGITNQRMNCNWCDSYSHEACNDDSVHSYVHNYGPKPSADNTQCPSCPAWPVEGHGDLREPSIHDVKSPAPFAVYPCDANPDCKVCHRNGCDQCETGFFKMSYALPCLSCSLIKGCTGSCQDQQGCSQCGSGNNWFLKRAQCTWQGVDIWICLRPDANGPGGFETCAKAMEHNGWKTDTDLPTASPSQAPSTSAPTTSPSRAPTCDLIGNKVKCDWCDSESNAACTKFKAKYCTQYKCPDGYAGAQECPSCPWWDENERGHMAPPNICDAEGKPKPAGWQPAQVAYESWPCDNNPNCKVCHANGCDQCEQGYFKARFPIKQADGSTKVYQTGCIKCGKLSDWSAGGAKCQVCQELGGCSQCTNNVQPILCGGVMSCKPCEKLYDGCDGSGERVYNPSPDNGGAASRSRDESADAKNAGVVAAVVAAGMAGLAAVVGAALVVRRLRSPGSPESAASESMMDEASRSQGKSALDV